MPAASLSHGKAPAIDGNVSFFDLSGAKPMFTPATTQTTMTDDVPTGARLYSEFRGQVEVGPAP